MVRSFFQQAMIQMARLKMQSRTLHLDLDAERKQRELRRTHVDQLHLAHENLLYQRAHIQREIEKCKDLPTPNIDEVQREMEYTLGTTVYVDNLSDINKQTIAALINEKEERISMKRKLDELEEKHAKSVEELRRKRKYLDDIPDQVGKIRATSKDLAEDLTSIVKEIRERNKRLLQEEQKKLLDSDKQDFSIAQSDEDENGKKNDDNTMSIDEELVNEDNGLQGLAELL